jgi:hypothetical protein
MPLSETLLIVALVATVIAGIVLTLIRGILVDRTRAKNKQFIMNHYEGLTGWPKEDATSSAKPDRSDGTGHQP